MPDLPQSRRQIGRVLHRAFIWAGWSNVAAVMTTVAAISALWFTAESLRATDSSNASAQQLAITDRFQKASELLDSEKMNSRVTGVYLFEKLAQDSPSDHPVVVAALTTFIQERAGLEIGETCPSDGSWSSRLDVKAAVIVLGRRNVEHDNGVLDLAVACLANMGSAGADFESALLHNSDLRGAWLQDANLRWASLLFVNLQDANLAGADLSDAAIQYANLAGADMKGATLAGANLGNVHYDEKTEWPAGFTPPPSIPEFCINPFNLNDPSC